MLVRLLAKPALVYFGRVISTDPAAFSSEDKDPLYTHIIRRNVIGSQPDAMNVTEVIILLTFVISSDNMYQSDHSTYRDIYVL